MGICTGLSRRLPGHGGGPMKEELHRLNSMLTIIVVICLLLTGASGIVAYTQGRAYLDLLRQHSKVTEDNNRLLQWLVANGCR
jgi:hypothetical protein